MPFLALLLAAGCSEATDSVSFRECAIETTPVADAPEVSLDDLAGTWELVSTGAFDAASMGPIVVEAVSWDGDWVRSESVPEEGCLPTLGAATISTSAGADLTIQGSLRQGTVGVHRVLDDEPEALVWSAGPPFELELGEELSDALSGWLLADRGAAEPVARAELAVGGELFRDDGTFAIFLVTGDGSRHGLEGQIRRIDP